MCVQHMECIHSLRIGRYKSAVALVPIITQPCFDGSAPLRGLVPASNARCFLFVPRIGCRRPQQSCTLQSCTARQLRMVWSRLAQFNSKKTATRRSRAGRGPRNPCASRSASCLPKCSKQPVAIRSTEGSVLSPAIQFDVAVLARNKRELDSSYERGNSYLQEQKTLSAQEVLQRSLKFQSGSLFGGRTAVALSNSLLYGTKRQIPVEPAAGKGACRQGGKESLKGPSRHSLQHRELASDWGRGETRVKGRT